MAPGAPPVRAATALAMISALLGIGALLVLLAGLVLPANLFGAEDMTVVIVLGAILLVGGLVATGLGIAQLILAILVVVRGRGLLRRGGIVLLVAWALGISISFSASGDPSMMPDGVAMATRVFAILGIVVELLRAVLMLVGAAILLRGIAELRRRRDPSALR